MLETHSKQKKKDRKLGEAVKGSTSRFSRVVGGREMRSSQSLVLTILPPPRWPSASHRNSCHAMTLSASLGFDRETSERKSTKKKLHHHHLHCHFVIGISNFLNARGWSCENVWKRSKKTETMKHMLSRYKRLCVDIR